MALVAPHEAKWALALVFRGLAAPPLKSLREDSLKQAYRRRARDTHPESRSDPWSHRSRACPGFQRFAPGLMKPFLLGSRKVQRRHHDQGPAREAPVSQRRHGNLPDPKPNANGHLRPHRSRTQRPQVAPLPGGE